MAFGGWGAAASTGAWGAPKSMSLHDDEDEEAAVGPAPLFAGQPSAAYSNRGTEVQPSRPFQPPPAAAAAFSSSQGPSNANREAQLKKREAELDAKEKELKALEEQLKASGVVLKKKNWPICYPLLRHNIAEDIPEKSRRVVREIYFCWWGLVVCMLWNFFCASTVLGTSSGNKVPSWFLSIFFAALGIPLAFWGWYLSIYDAGANDSTLGYLKFFLCFGINCLWCIWCAVGPQIGAASWSFAGWLTAFIALGQTTFIGIIYLVGASMWSALSVYCLWCLKDSYLFFRGKGGVEQAKQDAALAAFRAGMQQRSRPTT